MVDKYHLLKQRGQMTVAGTGAARALATWSAEGGRRRRRLRSGRGPAIIIPTMKKTMKKTTKKTTKKTNRDRTEVKQRCHFSIYACILYFMYLDMTIKYHVHKSINDFFSFSFTCDIYKKIYGYDFKEKIC